MFSDWKNLYCQNEYITQGNLQIQYNPYQITNGIFHRNKPKNSKFIWKHKRPQIAKAIEERKTKLEESNSNDFRLY